MGVEFHEIIFPFPLIKGSAEQIVHLENVIRINPEIMQRQSYPAALLVVGIQVDHDKEDIARIGRHFAVCDNRIIINGMKPE